MQHVLSSWTNLSTPFGLCSFWAIHMLHQIWFLENDESQFLSTLIKWCSSDPERLHCLWSHFTSISNSLAYMSPWWSHIIKWFRVQELRSFGNHEVIQWSTRCGPVALSLLLVSHLVLIFWKCLQFGPLCHLVLGGWEVQCTNLTWSLPFLFHIM